jgi:spermidine/putrescine-binding protein
MRFIGDKNFISSEWKPYRPDSFGLICILFLLLALASSGKAEELRILCWEGYAVPQYTERFEQFIKVKYGIDLTVTVRHLSDPQDFFDNVRVRKADLISPSHNIPKSDRWPFIRGKIVLPIDLANIPNYKYIIPELQKAEYITQGNQVYGVPILYGPYGLAYNTHVVKVEPTSWKVLWDPEFAGKYAISADYHEANIYITALTLDLTPEQIFDRDIENLVTREFKERLHTLAQNAKAFWAGVDTADALQGLALATAWGFSFPELKKRGEVWKMAQPEEGTTGWVDNWMIGYSLKDKPFMKRIAEEWINYCVGPEVQVGYLRNLAQCPVNLSIKDFLQPEEIETYHLNDPDYFRKHFILWEPLSSRQQNAFKRLWLEAIDKQAK